ncbi:MAG TPA: ABC transporter permease [Firmicutes bacterium]|nr:ABC transporter permease [Candidatus Fermentithermobacillaceae bacterium]
MKGLRRLATVEMKMFIRETESFFFTLVFPLILLFIFGSIYGNKPSSFFGGHGAVDVSVPGYVSLIIANAGFMTMGATIAGYREQGVLRRYRATPLSPVSLLAAQLLTVLIMTVSSTLLLTAAAKAFYDLKFYGSILHFAGAFAVSLLSLCAGGFVVASIARSSRAATLMLMTVFYPMIFLSGATIPREVLPSSVQKFSKILPLTHSVTILRGTWFGGNLGEFGSEIFVLVILAGLCIAVSGLAFRWE